MEATHLEIDGYTENLMGASHTLANPSIPPAQAENFGNPRFAQVQTSFAKNSTTEVDNKVSVEKITPPSVSNCFVFKSRLQEFAQKAGLLPPVYDTIKEGPAHKPYFRSTVILDNVRYESLPGFFNRKAAEQSAAEVALVELSKSVDVKFGISQPVHDTGLCKNLLQEYAQKMNYAIPLYECHREEPKQGKTPTYYCVAEIGGIKYIGASASSKRGAEFKVARTALLAIQSSTSVSENQCENSSTYTVVPPKKATDTSETAASLKTKKGRINKQRQNNKKRGAAWWDKKKGGESKKDGDGVELNVNGQIGVENGPNNVSGPHNDTGDCLEGKTDNSVSFEESNMIGAHQDVSDCLEGKKDNSLSLEKSDVIGEQHDFGDCLEDKTDNSVSFEESGVNGKQHDVGDCLEVKTDNPVECEEPYVIGACMDMVDCFEGKRDILMSHNEPDVIGCHYGTVDPLEVKFDDFVSGKEPDVIGSRHNMGDCKEVETDNVASFKEPDVIGSNYNNMVDYVKTDNLVSFQESDGLNSDHNMADRLEVKTDNLVSFQESDVLNSDHNMADCLEVKTDNFVDFREPGSGLLPVDSTTTDSCDARFCNSSFESHPVSFDNGRHSEDGGEYTAMNVHP